MSLPDPEPESPCVFCTTPLRLSNGRWWHVEETAQAIRPGHYPTPYSLKHTPLCVCGRKKTSGFELCGLCWWRMRHNLPQTMAPPVYASSQERMEAARTTELEQIADHDGVHRGQHPWPCLDCNPEVEEPAEP